MGLLAYCKGICEDRAFRKVRTESHQKRLGLAFGLVQLLRREISIRLQQGRKMRVDSQVQGKQSRNYGAGTQ